MIVPISSSCWLERSRSDLTNRLEENSAFFAEFARCVGILTRHGSAALFRRTEAAQRVQSCGGVLVAGWALAQGLAQVLPVFSVPNWVIQLVVVLIVLGLPVALGLAWAFELTPEGIKRTETADAMPEATRRKKYVWIYVVVIGRVSIDRIIFSRSLLGCSYATRSSRYFGKIDRGPAV